MERARQVGDGERLIDARMAEVRGFTAVCALRGEGVSTLVDAGVSVSAPAVLEGPAEAGTTREEVLYIPLARVHPDHAGGFLLPESPGARAIGSRKGLDAVAQPGRQVAGARRSLDAPADTYGGMVPIPRERILAAEEVEALYPRGKTLRTVRAPGHASSHLRVVDEASGTPFSGAAPGIRLAEEGGVIPVTPPPDCDLEGQRRALERLAGLAARAPVLCTSAAGAGAPAWPARPDRPWSSCWRWWRRGCAKARNRDASRGSQCASWTRGLLRPYSSSEA